MRALIVSIFQPTSQMVHSTRFRSDWDKLYPSTKKSDRLICLSKTRRNHLFICRHGKNNGVWGFPRINLINTSRWLFTELISKFAQFAILFWTEKRLNSLPKDALEFF